MKFRRLKKLNSLLGKDSRWNIPLEFKTLLRKIMIDYFLWVKNEKATQLRMLSKYELVRKQDK